jgi:tetratricopeptide (TPR) repeat protein
MILLILPVVGLAALATGWNAWLRRPAAPPRLAELGAMAPEVSTLLQQGLAAIEEDRANAAQWARFGMMCHANGLFGAARTAYAQATRLDPHDTRSLYRLAIVDARAGRIDEAIAAARRVAVLAPGYAAAHRRLGLWLLDRDDVDGAERALSRAIELEPDDASGWAGLARVYLQRNRNERAADLLEKLLARLPGNRYALQLLGTAYRRLGRMHEAEFALALGMAGEPSSVDPWLDEMVQFRRGFAVLLKDATDDFLNGRFDAAISTLEELRRQRPDDLALLSHLGQVYVAAGRAEQGTALLEQVVAQDPERFEAHVNLASGYLQQNDLTRARPAIDRAIALNPALGRAHETKGLILWRAGDERSALAALQDAVRYDPRDVKAFLWMGMIEMNRGRPANALESFGRATRLDPTLVDAWVGIANGAMALGALDRASAALDRAQQLNPDAEPVKQAVIRLRQMRP